jgi:hypothetical protein
LRVLRANVVWISALAALAVTYAVPVQAPNWGQNAHYSLIESLADGTPRIDRYHDQTGDTAYVDGHYYAAKAPGLALVELPWFLGLDAVGAIAENPNLDRGFPAAVSGVPEEALWALGLLGTLLPALALVALFRVVATQIAPETATVSAIALGLATLVLPFATILYAHELAVALAFGAFAILFLRRSGILGSPVLAGLLAGLAVTTDFPLALLACALAVYSWGRAPMYLAGLVVGVTPLLAFNSWAFGSPFRLSYAAAGLEPGRTDAAFGWNSGGFFGVTAPSARVAAELLFAAKGLVTLTPVVAAGAAGLILLYRRGFRAEGLLAGTIALVYLVYNSGYFVPFGGLSPGPRFLIPVLPFVALGLPLAFRRWPGATLALAAVSVAAMVVATAAEPLLVHDDTRSWLERWWHGDFTHTVAGSGWTGIAPFLLAAAAAAVLAASTLSRPRLDATTVAVVGAWLVLLLAVPDLLRNDRLPPPNDWASGAVHQPWGLVAAAGLLVALALLLARPSPISFAAAAPMGALALPGFASHAKASLCVCGLALGLTAASTRFAAPRCQPTSAETQEGATGRASVPAKLDAST